MAPDYDSDSGPTSYDLPSSGGHDISQGHEHTKLGAGRPQFALTLPASGVIVPPGDRAWIILDTLGGAATDDLDGLAIANWGVIVIISPANDARNIVLRHNQTMPAGNAAILTPDATSITLSSTRHFAMLMSHGAAGWHVINVAAGAGGGPFFCDYLVDQDYTGVQLAVRSTEPTGQGGWTYKVCSDLQLALNDAITVGNLETNKNARTFFIRGNHYALIPSGGQPSYGLWTFIGVSEPQPITLFGLGAGGTYSAVRLDCSTSVLPTLQFRTVAPTLSTGNLVAILDHCGGGAINVTGALSIYANDSSVTSITVTSTIKGYWRGGSVGDFNAQFVAPGGSLEIGYASIRTFVLQQSLWQDGSAPNTKLSVHDCRIAAHYSEATTPPSAPAFWLKQFYGGVVEISHNQFGAAKTTAGERDIIRLESPIFGAFLDWLDISHNEFGPAISNTSPNDLHPIHIAVSGLQSSTPGSHQIRGVIKNNIWDRKIINGSAPPPTYGVYVTDSGSSPLQLDQLSIENNIPSTVLYVAPGAQIGDPCCHKAAVYTLASRPSVGAEGDLAVTTDTNQFWVWMTGVRV